MDDVERALFDRAEQKAIRNPAGLVQPRAVSSPLVVMFSYAWLPPDQQEIQLQFYQALQFQLRHPPERFRYLPPIELWRDEERIDLAQLGAPQMNAACEEAFLAVIMASDKYEHSAACMREAAYFLDAAGSNLPGKRCIVVRFNCDLRDMSRRFKYQQRISFAAPEGRHLLAFWAKADPADRQALARHLADKVFENAEQWLGARKPKRGASGQAEEPPPFDEVAQFVAQQRSLMGFGDDRTTLPFARPGPVSAPLDMSPLELGGGVNIIQHIIEWAREARTTSPRIIALLGDFGMGKTVTCQAVTYRMLAEDKGGPAPVYFDLRDIPRPEDAERLTLETIIEDLLVRGGSPAPSAEAVIEHVRRESCLVIFDGLDEIANKYTVDVARVIYRQLISIVPRAFWREDTIFRRALLEGVHTLPKGIPTSVPERRRGPSVLLTCRRQYFADFAAERGFLSDSDRSQLEPGGDINVFVMLPFTSAQVEDYLRRNLSDVESADALDLIASTYNLSELAERPILLRYIQELLHALRAEKAAGKIINISRLYDILVRQVLERDSPKHVIPIHEKHLLLAQLALHLHGRAQEEIPNARLIDWLEGEIATRHPRLARALEGKDGLRLSEVFVQDLRNATLLSRPGLEGFRFAHTSLREYFLAAGLYAAAFRGEGASAWSIPDPSDETIDFLLKRFELDELPERRAFEKVFPSLLEADQPAQTRRLAFRIWLRSHRDGIVLPRPERLDCRHLDLVRYAFIGLPDRLFPLQNSCWEGAELSNVRFDHADLSGADFHNADLYGSSFSRCDLGGAQFQRARLLSSRWERCELDEGALVGALLNQAIATECTLAGHPWYPQQVFGESAGQWAARMRAVVSPLPPGA